MELRDDREVTGKQAITPTAKVYILVIDKGNTLEEGSDGILYEETVDTVPALYDPEVDVAFVDGIGRASLYVNGELQEKKVLVVNSNLGTFRNALFQNDPITSGGTVKIPLAGDNTKYVRAWTVGT